MKKEVNVENLASGDYIQVLWLDASESTRKLPRRQMDYDTPILSAGWFIGLKGRKTKHAVIAKEIIVYENQFHYNVIPVGMINKIWLVLQGDLETNLKTHLQKKIVVTPLKRFTISKEGGWLKYG